jgi:deazaflavin-dependent oxidoreductase (nitroreductase family)
MALPRWLARLNKRTFNPIEVRRGRRPVLIHRGRTTGRTFRTPLDAHRVDGGYVLIPMYGPQTDWLRNVLAAGEARLRVDGREVPLSDPRLVMKRDVWHRLSTATKPPAGITDESELLYLKIADEDSRLSSA